MKVSLFEINSKKKWTFSTYSIFIDVLVKLLETFVFIINFYIYFLPAIILVLFIALIYILNIFSLYTVYIQ